MEVNQGVLQKLICSVCEEYLSVGPVLLLPYGQMSVCGRCPAPYAIEALWNQPYEYLAEQVLFPCRNAKLGCTVKCVFGETQQNHEEDCEFRQFNCCILETSTCKWIGTRRELLQHCKDTHPQHVVANPAIFGYDMFKSSVKYYLMTAFQMLFLIHIKVCLTSKQIYHYVGLLGDSGNIGNFNYSLVISNEDNKVTKKGDVTKQGCLAITEDYPMEINIVQGIFTNFTTVTLTVNKLIEKMEQQKRLQDAAEVHIKFSEIYLPMLRSLSESDGSEKNPSPWKTVKEGSYFLGNAYSLVQTYKKYMPVAIDDKNMQVINATLVALEFDPKHITSGYTNEAYGGEARCFISKGQGTVYYKLLNSELKNDVRMFIEMVERDIDIPVKMFLKSVKQKLQSVSFK